MTATAAARLRAAVDRTHVPTAAFAAAVALVAVWLHVRAGYSLPRPWPDESHFIAPALALVREGTLAVPELNAPSGIFWMPMGYYLVQAPAIALGVDALAANRLLSLAGIIVFAGCIAAATTATGLNRWVAMAAPAAWLCFPRVVAIGNIARMEGLVLAMAGACVLLAARRRWPAAFGVALLAPLLHPIGVVVTVAVGAAVLVRRTGRPWSRAERALVVVAAAAWVAQLAVFAAHADLTAAHMGFQLARKVGRAVGPAWWQWALLAVIAAVGLGATASWRRGTAREQALWIALALAGGLVVVDIAGREMWYQPLGRETAALLLFLVGGALVIGRRWNLVTAAAVVAAAVTAGVGVQSTMTDSWHGMRTAPSSRAEWNAFAHAGVRALQRLDRSATAPATVVVDPLSGFGQEVFSSSWRRLRFVQPTPATPLPPDVGDYLLATPGAPFTSTALVGRWGPVRLDVSSENQRYRLQLRTRPSED